MEKRKILVIDDEADFTDLVKNNLEALGIYEVLTENSAKNAFKKAKKFKPHLIFLDIRMPEMDGGEVITFLDADPELKSIPVVFLTALVKEDEFSFKQKGLNFQREYLTKPVTTDNLVQCIEKYII